VKASDETVGVVIFKGVRVRSCYFNPER
jgi:hypothetical protein